MPFEGIENNETYFAILLPDTLALLVEDSARHDHDLSGISFGVLRFSVELLHPYTCVTWRRHDRKKKREENGTIKIFSSFGGGGYYSDEDKDGTRPARIVDSFIYSPSCYFDAILRVALCAPMDGNKPPIYISMHINALHSQRWTPCRSIIKKKIYPLPKKYTGSVPVVFVERAPETILCDW